MDIGSIINLVGSTHEMKQKFFLKSILVLEYDL